MNESFLERTWAEIDLSALAANYRTVTAGLRPGCRAIAVVKADAYGHGAVFCARRLREAGVGYFAVSNLEEAIQLRQGGITEPVLILSYTPPTEAPRLAQYAVTQAVTDAAHGAALEQEAAKSGVTLTVHIKVDTGMSRVGFFCQQDEAAAEEIAAVCRLPHLNAEGIFTHFAVADEPDKDDYTRWQFRRFTAVIERLKQLGITFPLQHCCNSAALWRFPEMHLTAVRPGIVLYGSAPVKGIPLTPVMTLKTRISQVKTVPAATCISYGCTHRTAGETRIATVPIGYADGLSRRLSGQWTPLIGGVPVPLLGRVCMDQCMLDVSALPTAKAGDEVVVMGGTGVCSAEAMAQAVGTISYECFCAVSKRVPRRFRQNGQTIGQLNYLL